MITVEDAFLKGLKLAKEAFKSLNANAEIKGSDCQVLAAYRVFCKKAKKVEMDDNFEKQGPLYAKHLIITAYSL
jgi:hypothetical protein